MSYLLLIYLVIRLVFATMLTDWRLPNLTELSSRYRTSQYCLSGLRQQFQLDQLFPSYAHYCGDGQTFTGNIDDPELYVFAGASYVAGASPDSINWELSPLTKYLFGWLQAVGLSPLVGQWVFYLILLWLLYLLGRESGLSESCALLPLTLIVSDNLFFAALTRPYLDLAQTTLILLTLYQLVTALKSRRAFHFALLCLGLVALSKTFSLGLVLLVVGAILVAWIDRSRLTEYLATLWVSLGVYCAGYLMFFFHHGLFNWDFLTLHVTILRFYRSYVPEYPWGEIWRVLVLGQWQTWWGEGSLVRVPEWSPLWPSGLFALLLSLRHLRRSPVLAALCLWTIIYLLFASLRLVFPRYLLPVLPVLYLAIAHQLQALSVSYNHHQ